MAHSLLLIAVFSLFVDDARATYYAIVNIHEHKAVCQNSVMPDQFNSCIVTCNSAVSANLLCTNELHHESYVGEGWVGL